MNILRYDPWRFFNQVHREMSNAFDAHVSSQTGTASLPRWMPAVDVEDHSDRYVIRADIPGVDPKLIDIQTEGGVLTIRGTRDATQDADAKYVARETLRGEFVRRFTLPDRVNAEAITARSTHGVLEVVIPKSSEVQARQIKIEH